MAGRANTKKRFSRSQEGCEQLLPGIPNEITLEEITSKLPWRTLHVLSSVSRSWEDAVRTNEVYDARVRANSTEALVVHLHCYRERDALALYSTTEKCSHELPQIPGFRRGTLKNSSCIELYGKLYVLGGGYEGDRGQVKSTACAEVYVLDLARPRRWKQCRSMLQARLSFGCGVMDGKIYVFGGLTVGNFGLESVVGSEVYDPLENYWSPIMRMREGRFDHQVPKVGKELFLWGGKVSLEPDWYSLMSRRLCGCDSSIDWRSSEDMSLGVYNPVKNEWRSVDDFWPDFGEAIRGMSQLFMSKEKFYFMSQSGIDVYDSEQNSWVNRHANSFGAGLLRTYSALLCPGLILAVNDTLFWGAVWDDYNTGTMFRESLHCKGFDSEKNEMVWQKTSCSFGACLFYCSVQV